MSTGPAKMKPPEKGRKPKRIETKNPPGGPHTPGAKKKRKKNADSEGHRLTGINQ